MKKSLLAVPVLLFLLPVIVGCEKPAASIIADPSQIEVGPAGSETQLSIRSNRDWTATCDSDWCVITPSSGYSLDADSYAFVKVLPNDGEERETVILIRSNDGAASFQINVSQGKSATNISDAEELAAFFTKVEKREVPENVVFRLSCSIDLAGIALPEVHDFYACLDGCNNSLKNWETSRALVDTVSSTGKISGLVIDKSCKLTIPQDAPNSFGFVANYVTGIISDVVNNADVAIAGISKGYKGVIAGENTNVVSNCVNNGNVAYSGPSHNDGSAYFGGVLGRTNGGALDGNKNNGSISVSFTTAMTQSLYLAGITGAVNNNGSIKNSTNKADLKVVTSGSSTNLQASGIVCYAGGEVADCVNEGNIGVYVESAEGKADGAIKGTGVAGVACYFGWKDGVMTHCSNSGNITLRAGFSEGYQTVGSAKKFATNVAGVAGHAYSCGFNDCHNTGNITCHIKSIEKATDAAAFNTAARHSVGGVVASSWGLIESCSNSGIIDIMWTTTSHDAALAKNFVCQAGGISGGDYHSDQISTSITDCVNKGAVNITCDSAGSNNAFGGIVGWPGKESTACVNVVSGCENEGAITLEGYSKSRLGGISGGAVTLKDCTNKGAVTYKSGAANSSVGGINGFGNFFNVSGCRSYGDVKSEVKLAGAETSAAGGVGAIVGAIGNTAVSYSGCKVNCKVDAPDGSAASMIIGVIGQNKSVTTALSVGTEEAPIMVKGSFNGVVLTADNFESYIRRPDWSLVNNNIKFCAQFGE